MANALYDYINYCLLSLLTQLKTGKVSISHSTAANALLLQLGASAVDGINQKYVNAFNAILYVLKNESIVEAPVISISKKSKKIAVPTVAAAIVDKDNKPLTEDHILKSWLDAEGSIPESVSTFLSVIKADNEEKDRVEREKKAAQILKVKPISSLVKAAPVTAPQQEIVQLPVEPATFKLTIPGKTAKKKPEYERMKVVDAIIPEPVAPIPTANLATKLLSDWELQCIWILKKLSRHDYVDINRDKCICNFYTPVLVLNPNLVDYVKIIKHPMDLSTLGEMIDTGGLTNQLGVYIPPVKDPLDFYRKLISVFSNTVVYNEGHMDSAYANQLVKKCKHLIRYCKWLCLEKLPLQDAGSASTIPSVTPDIAELDDFNVKSLVLSVSARDKHRALRLNNYVKKYGQASKDIKVISDCKNLLKDLERLCTKTTQDRKVYSWFNV